MGQIRVWLIKISGAHKHIVKERIEQIETSVLAAEIHHAALSCFQQAFMFYNTCNLVSPVSTKYMVLPQWKPYTWLPINPTRASSTIFAFRMKLLKYDPQQLRKKIT